MLLRWAARLLGFLVFLGLTEGTYRAWLWADGRARRDSTAQAFELYAVGESTAAGVPYPRRTAPPFLVKKILGGTVDRRTIAVTDLAEAGMSIYPQAVKFERAIAGRRGGNPGAVLIYSGHNDAAYDAETPLWEYAREEWLNRSAMLRDGFFLVEKRFPAARVRTLATYEYHLRRVVELSLASGLTPVLTTTASNLADMDSGDGARFGRARLLARRGRTKQAAALFRACVEAREPDNFGRATAAQNAVVRRLAREYGAPLVDAEALFAAASPGGAPGNDLFIDGQHPNFRGYVLLARAYADALAAAFRAPVFERLEYSPRLLDELGVSRPEQALAEVEAGRWLFSAAARRDRPARRLDAAEARFRRALELDPGSASARVGLALALAARRPGFVDRNADWLGARKLFYGGRYEVAAADRPELLDRLRAGGVPKAQLEGLSRALAGSGL